MEEKIINTVSQTLTFETPIGYISLHEMYNVIFKIDISNHNIKKVEIKENTFLNNCKNQILEYFEKKRQHFDFKLNLKGTDFQKLVWGELLNIPFGKTITYKELAIKINKPKSFRAVANAVGKNPIPIIIPCHRVIGSNNKLGGFSIGIDKKIILMKIENIDYSKLK